MKKKKILSISGIRSDYDLMSNLFIKLNKDSNIDFGLIVTGAHLEKKYGYTYNEILKDKIKVIAKVKSFIGGTGLSPRALSLFKQGTKMVSIVKKFKPNLILTMGDREESIVISLIATYLNIPIAHISGGDKVVGNIDDHIRHAVSKLAHIHYPTSLDSKNRLIKLGENKKYIFNYGNPGLDRLKQEKRLSLKAISKKLNFEIKKEDRYFVCIQHSLSSEFNKSHDQMFLTLNCLKELKIKTIIIYPNSDAGSEGIISAINKFKNVDFFCIKKNLPRNIFVNLLRNCRCLIGNSSAGILETPFLGKPSINIGKRQSKRHHAKNTIFISSKKKTILNTINMVGDNKFYKKISKINYIFGSGNASDKIIKSLKSIKIGDNFFNKEIKY